MKFLLAKKVNMTQVFGEDGTAYPVTVVKTGPVSVAQVKEMARDGYKAVQLAFGEKKEKNISKPLLGHLKGVNAQVLREYRPKGDEELPNLGDKLGLDSFSEGDLVTVAAVSKGKGFQGVVKRHGFKGGRRSHGQKHSEREPGSIGGGGRAGGRVVKGMRMAGRMGGNRVTVKNLKIVKILPETSELMIEGAIPGRRGTLVEIKGK
jgi:large subunit ribosomal protein L3